MPDESNENIIFIAGPTASGKSAAALALAEKIGGEIINADAMQVYRDLRILTARPGNDDEARIAHHLYGFLDGGESCSAGRWAVKAAEIIAETTAQGRAAIIVGGTGFYFKALEDGMSPIPETPPDIRREAAARHRDLGPAAFRDEVVANDPGMAHLPEGDGQRLMRAWEVFAATGKPLSGFQNLPREQLIAPPRRRIVIAPTREALYQRCDQRAEIMLGAGAMDEVRALLARNLDPGLPVMKTLGVREIAGFLDGALDHDEALAALQQNTRRFAKRQMTWFRGQASGWPRCESVEQAVDRLSSGSDFG